MTNLFILIESITNGSKTELLSLLSLISILAGISIIITKNPVLSVLFLIILFFTVAVYLMVLGFYFIGLSYLLVYVGAVSILFLFILMLINVRISELLTEGTNSITLAILAIVSYNYTVGPALPDSVYLLDNALQPLFNFVTGLYVKFVTATSNLFGAISGLLPQGLYLDNQDKVVNITSQSWDSLLIETSHITSIGNTLYSNLFILLLVTSFILLLAMVGSIVITKRDNDTDLNLNNFPLNSSVIFPKGFKNIIFLLLIICIVSIMVKYPMFILTKQLNIPWLYTIYVIAFIYPLLHIRASLLNKNDKFSLIYFLGITVLTIILGYLTYNGYIHAFWGLIYGTVIPYSPANLGKYIASQYPLPSKMYMLEAKITPTNLDNFHKAEGSSQQTISTHEDLVVHKENLDALKNHLTSLESKKDQFIFLCKKRDIDILDAAATSDGCIQFACREIDDTFVLRHKTEIQVELEKAMNTFVKTQNLANKLGIAHHEINQLGKGIMDFQKKFPLFNKEEFLDIQRECYDTKGTREIIDPWARFSTGSRSKRLAEQNINSANKIAKSVK